MSDQVKFSHHVFISYAHIDNEALAEGEDGWISNFHRALEVRLNQLLGERARIWRDAKLQGNDVFSETLIENLDEVALLVSVVSPRYLKSEWCLREFNEFCHNADEHYGLQIQDKVRIFKVVKTPVTLDEQPEIMQRLLGYEFYEVDSASHRPREFRQDAGENKDLRYWDKLEDLAYEITDLIGRIDERSDAVEPSTTPEDQSTVYLMPTTSDLRDEWDIVRRELHQRGYRILPNEPLPTTRDDLEARLADWLPQCDLAIQLVGSHYALVPEGAAESVAEIQCDFLARESRERALPRLIWMPSGIEANDDRQGRFLDRLRSDTSLLSGADLLETDLEELKACALSALEEKEDQGENSTTSEGPGIIYVCYHESDFEDAAEIEDHLFDTGFEVSSSLIEGSESERESEHRANLEACDALLLYYGAAPESWFRQQLRELETFVRTRTDRPLVATIYVGGPESRSKARVRSHQLAVVRNYDAFDPNELEAFLGSIRESLKQGATR